jgi:transposase
MAAATGMSQSAISRIWRAFGLKPHLVDSFKLSPDPQFIDKVRDIVGLYLNPPDAAMVLCVDEKSQIQALDRTSPVLPLIPGTPERRTHDYRRYGTTNLYAALDVASGKVITNLTARHRAEEFQRFLNQINREVPDELDVHVIVDNSSTHKTPAIQRWLLRHPRFTLHFTPTYSSWLNLVERWFAELTNKWLRRGTHRSTKELETAISSWARTWNTNPRPFVWHKTADEILTNLANYCEGSLTQVTRRERPRPAVRSGPAAALQPAAAEGRRRPWPGRSSERCRSIGGRGGRASRRCLARDPWLGREQIRIDVLHGLADLDEAHAHGVKPQARR